ncbi:MAG: hypothetical protein QW327_06345 [Candidatus Odinarchaeota archaeon]
MVEHCPKCGLTAKPGDKYCRYCGSEMASKEELDDLLTEELRRKLVLKGKLSNLRDEKNKYLDELKILEDDLNNGRGSLIDVEKRLRYLKQQISNIKDEERRINLKDVKMPYEEIIEEKNRVSEQIEKLDKLLESGKIDERNYHELRDEFSSKINTINKNFEEIKLKMKRIYVGLKEAVKRHEKELEILTARYEIGQLDKDSYSKKERELRNKISDYKLCLEALKKEPLII